MPNITPEQFAYLTSYTGELHIPCCIPGEVLPGDSSILITNENWQMQFGGVSQSVAEVNVSDGAFAPTFNNENIYNPPGGDVTVSLDTSGFSWPEVVVDLVGGGGDIVVNSGGVVINGTIDFPPDPDTGDPVNPKVVSQRYKSLYSSIINDRLMIRRLTRTLLNLYSDDPGGTPENWLLTAYPGTDGIYRNEIGYYYFRLFTYGEYDELINGTSLLDRGTGGLLGEVWPGEPDEATPLTVVNPGDLNSWAGVGDRVNTVQREFPVASISETNIQSARIWANNVDLRELDASFPLLPERGVQNDVHTAFSVQSIAFRILNQDPFEEDVNQAIIRSLFASGLLRIERLRVNYTDAFDPTGETDYTNRAGAPEHAYEHVRHKYVWQPLFSCPLEQVLVSNKDFVFEARTNLSNTSGYQPDGAGGWEAADPQISNDYQTEQLIINPATLGTAVPGGVFLAPGAVWRARIVLDPYLMLWNLRIVMADTVDPAVGQINDFPYLIPNIKLQLTLNGYEIGYEWPSDA